MQEAKNHMNYSAHFSVSVLNCIFSIFGINIQSGRSSKFRRSIIWICQKIILSCMILCVFFFAKTIFNSEEKTKLRLKANISNLLVHTIWLFLWLSITQSQTKISRAIRDICSFTCVTEVKKINKLEIFIFVFTFVSYVYFVLFQLYPFTEEGYAQLNSRFSIEKLHNKIISIIIAFFTTVLSSAIYSLLPHSFIALYVILCNMLHTIIILYTKEAKREEVQDPKHILKRFSYYMSAMQIFQFFEEIFSKIIFVVFSGFVISLILRLTVTSEMELNFSFEVLIIFDVVSISFICLVASRVNEADKAAKEVNLQYLEMLLKHGNQLQLDKAFHIYRLSSAPAFALSAWGFFCFTKGLYLSVLGGIVTYTLLVVKL